MTQQLRIWWIPQVPGKPFQIEVLTLVEAKLILIALAGYDIFQFKNKIKPDYSNAGGLEILEEEDESRAGHFWTDWCDETGKTIDDYTLEELREMERQS